MKTHYTQDDLDRIEAFGKYLDAFRVRALKKFMAGCLEHDQDFYALDFEAEIEAEFIDLIAYQFGRSVKLKLDSNEKIR